MYRFRVLLEHLMSFCHTSAYVNIIFLRFAPQLADLVVMPSSYHDCLQELTRVRVRLSSQKAYLQEERD